MSGRRSKKRHKGKKELLTMSFFVNGRPETVSDDRGNQVTILGRMGIGVEAAVSADFVALGGKAINAYQLCLLRHNILSWEGPDFTIEDENGEPRTIPCSRANIDRLDMTNPTVKALVTAVINKITELNQPAEAEVSKEEAAAVPEAERPTSAAKST